MIGAYKERKASVLVMKKILAVLLCGSLMMFAGCSAEQSSSSEPETEQSSSSQAEESSSQEEESSSAAEGEIDPAVQEMMDALAAYQPGTAGSSLKVYIAACGVLNYAEEYDSSMEDTLRSSVEAWMAQADETTLECLREGREAVGIAAAEILTESEESKSLLADAGNPNKYETYHPEKYDEVVLVLHELLDGDSNN